MHTSKKQPHAATNQNYRIKQYRKTGGTVPAGTFEAMKIQVEPTLNINVGYGGFSLPVTVGGTYTYWFVQNIGWVKASGTGNFAGQTVSETIELQSYHIP